MRERQLVGMVIPDGTNQFFSTLAQAFQRELAKGQWAPIVVNSDGSFARELNYLQMILSMNVKGLLFISVGDSLRAFELLAESKIPVVVLDREVPLENADFVLVDNKQGVYLAIEYLCSLGHERIACIQGAMNTEPGRERFDSFIDSCNSFGVEIDEDLIFTGNFMFGSGTTAAEQIVKIPDYARPTAIFACNDLMAAGTMQRLQEHGVRVPDEISVIGYDDIQLSSWVWPKLTTIRQDPLEIAHVGAAYLLERIDALQLDPKASVNTRVHTISPKLVKRDSCRGIA